MYVLYCEGNEIQIFVFLCYSKSRAKDLVEHLSPKISTRIIIQKSFSSARWILKIYPEDNIKSLIQRVERQIGTGSVRLKFVSYRIGMFHEKLFHAMTDFRVNGIENSHKSLIRMLTNLYCDWKTSKPQKEWFKMYHVHGIHTLTLAPEDELTQWQRKQIEIASYSDNPQSKFLDQMMNKTLLDEIVDLEKKSIALESDVKMDSDTFDNPVITGATLSASSSRKTEFGYLTSHEQLAPHSRKIQKIFHAWKAVIEVPENIFPNRKTKLAYANMKIFLGQSFKKGQIFSKLPVIQGFCAYDDHIWDYVVSFLVSDITFINQKKQKHLFMISCLCRISSYSQNIF